MATRELSPREEQIVQLCVEGLTNDGIANRLGLSIGTVNTYWLRIKLKVGGSGRTDTVVRVIQERAERVLKETQFQQDGLVDLVADKERTVVELRAALALLQLAMEQIKSTVWATDRDLNISIVGNGEFLSTHFGVKWEAGRSIYEIFKTKDPGDLAVVAHVDALAGKPSETRLEGEFANMVLRVMPVPDDFGEVMGCVSILNHVG